MKKLFIGILVVLVAAAFYTYWTEPSNESRVPVVYWKSDSNPQRYEQIEMFHRWLVRKGYVTPDGEPMMKLELDAGGNQSSLIQAVSGVGGDAIDAYVSSFQPLGVCLDITDMGKELNFGEKDTYRAIWPMLTSEGRQYAYPCNLGVNTWWGNLDTFRKYGMEAPPKDWNIEEFEKYGVEFVRRANEGKERQDVYFIPSIATTPSIPQMMARGEGVDMYNETLTRATINNPAYIRAFETVLRWTNDLHLAPSAAEVASMSSEGGYGGVNMSQFIAGKFGLVFYGRYCLIRFRESTTKINFFSTLPAMGDYKNVMVIARAAIMYRGSKHPELIKHFFEFLADKEYNDSIIEGADGLPPNPKFAENNPALYRPAAYPNEGDVHQNEFEWARDYGVIPPISPYFRGSSFDTWIKYALDKYFNNRVANAAEALQEAEDRYNESIDTTVAANPLLQEAYQRDVELQRRIDEYKAAGKKIPASWIKNPFYLKYYHDKGMLEETE